MRIQDRLVQAFRRNPSAASSRHRSPLKIAGLVGALLVAVLMISACNKVPMAESDDTAPRIDWRIIDALDGGLARGGTPLGETVTTAYAGEMIVVQLQAQDQQGVKRIKLSDPLMSYTCASGDGNVVVDDKQNLVLGYQEETLGPDEDGEVFSELWLLDTVYFNYECGDGLTLAEATATFFAEAENYFGGITYAELSVIHTP